MKFEWTPECQAGFDELKQRLTTYPILRTPIWDRPFHIYCDASAIAVESACVNQQMMEEETIQLLFLTSNYQRQSAITPP